MARAHKLIMAYYRKRTYRRKPYSGFRKKRRTTYSRKPMRMKMRSKRTSWKRKARVMVGTPRNSMTSKTQVQTIRLSLPDKTLNVVSMLSNIEQGILINQRERGMITLGGFKMHMYFKNLVQNPQYLNFCMVASKNSGLAAAGASFITPIGWFRGEGAFRATDFSSAITSLSMHNQKINTDDYIVLFHHRMTLAGKLLESSADVQTNIHNEWTERKMWVPVKRQIRYSGPTGEPTDTTIFFVHWTCPIDSTVINTPLPDSYVFEARFVTYYRDPPI